ncbi:[4Fe-4S] proteins maturation [Actinomortierella ambigua]|uniref:[4Fe-4S] proteins maturation n=1 Tax=Actinomortierella ambigua TaxID=1343610 RepID=A0A9P6Q065_9FUNG|nr:[4Fe-4S] proteins maturation [Actinomortierella ambigua]
MQTGRLCIFRTTSRLVSHMTTASSSAVPGACRAASLRTFSTSRPPRTLTNSKQAMYSMLSGTRQPMVLRTALAGQHRWSSSSAAATETTEAPAPASDLKVTNPQVDESGKELTIDITDKAVKQLKHIMKRDNNFTQSLRVMVDSGGCHGYQYLLDLTNEMNEDDVLFERDGARVVVDTITLPMISGARIDFIEELIGSAFKVLNNPHASHSCGCDTSFEIKI